MVIVACSRVFFCSIIIIVLGLLFLLLPAHHHHHHVSSGVGGHVLRRMRKMIAAIPHASPTSPGNLHLVNGRKLLYVHPRQPPSLGTAKTTSLDGTTDDLTKTKMGIISSTGGNHNDRQSGLVALPLCRRRRRRRLISAGPSNSQPSPGY